MAFTNALVAEHPIVFANESFLSLTGFERSEVLGRPFESIVASGESTFMSAFDADNDPRIADREFSLRRKDGRVLWVSIFVSPVNDDNGDIRQHFVSLFNITKHKEAETHSRILINELNHRVKNNLSTIQSLVRNSRGSHDLGEFRTSVENRVHTIARSHELLERSHWRSANLLDLVVAALEPVVALNGGPQDRIRIAGPDVVICANDSFALALAIHELGTNAQRFGALRCNQGSVSLTWETHESRVRVEWREAGGPLVSPPTRQGMGAYLIERGLAHALRGRIDVKFLPGGLHWTLDFDNGPGRDVD